MGCAIQFSCGGLYTGDLVSRYAQKIGNVAVIQTRETAALRYVPVQKPVATAWPSRIASNMLSSVQILEAHISQIAKHRGFLLVLSGKASTAC